MSDHVTFTGKDSCINIVNQASFQEETLSKYFKHSNYATFTR